MSRCLRATAMMLWLSIRRGLASMRDRCPGRRPAPVLGLKDARRGTPRGRALVSYRAEPLTWPDGHAGFHAHTNAWECREIARILLSLGYVVDGVDWDDADYTPRSEYDFVLDIHRNLGRVSSERSFKVLHVTGSHPEFSTEAELRRLEDVYRRRGVRLRPRRATSREDIEIFDRNLELADRVTLLGNSVTESTFSEATRRKLARVPVTGGDLRDAQGDLHSPNRRAFLWFGSYGAVHKGLDLVLEVFSRQPGLELHCVGAYERELDFVRAYRRELYGTPNIQSHGFLRPTDRRFEAILARSFAVVVPSCSEGTSTAVVTCMQSGLLPIVSTRCGIDLPAESGIALDSCSLQEIESAVMVANEMDGGLRRESMAAAREIASTAYSKEAFSTRMRQIITDALE